MMSARPDIDSRNILHSARAASLAELMSIWRARDIEAWSQLPELYRALGERALAHGEPLLAYDVVREGLGIWSVDVRLRQLQGLALARSGATERASAILEKLRNEGHADEETLGMLGRTFKDLASTAARPGEREHFLKRAAETYTEAYRLSKGPWSGINAATMMLLTGDNECAGNLARSVREQCLENVAKNRGDLYWEFATLGEAALVCRDYAQAKDWYARAAEHATKRYANVQSSRRNARLILRHWNQAWDWIDNYLNVPSVIVFAGHMIDRPDRPAPRFPPALEPGITRALHKALDQLKPGFGFSAAACGSDILFLEAMIDRGAEVSIVLPYNEEEFVNDSVDFIPNSTWFRRFRHVLERATRVITASNQRLEIGGVSYEFANQLMLGLGTIRARQLGAQLVPLAVWDGLAGDGPGGAASAIRDWRSLGYKPVIIDLPRVKAPRHAVRKTRGQTSSADDFRSRIVAILFADAVGFSKLTESEVPLFMRHFLGAISRLCDNFGDAIIAKNTWGDGLYFVFSNVVLAGKFALQLADLASKTKWEEKGLRSGLNLRIALHAGPVYEFDDPITGSRTYSGTHVSRAARIEPITPPGQVYTSEAFAALASALGAGDFTCDYVGQTPLAKAYGTLAMYHARSSGLS
jgi:class 3 adenylate cyclase